MCFMLVLLLLMFVDVDVVSDVVVDVVATAEVDVHSLRDSFFFYDPPTTQIYTLTLHDALPICR